MAHKLTVSSSDDGRRLDKVIRVHLARPSPERGHEGNPDRIREA